MTDTDEPVILVSKVYGVPQVRWFKDLWSAERNHLILSASAKGVKVYDVYLNEIPTKWLEDANNAYQALSADPQADVSHLATHYNYPTSNGPLRKVGD